MNEKQIFRYWVEVRELAGGSVRALPLTAVMKIALVDPPIPSEQALQLKDGAETWEAKTFNEVRIRLREKYPDDTFQRTLHYERDRKAEERRERALNGLAQLLAEKCRGRSSLICTE